MIQPVSSGRDEQIDMGDRLGLRGVLTGRGREGGRRETLQTVEII